MRGLVLDNRSPGEDKLGEGNDASHEFSVNYNGVWIGGHDVVGFQP
jgi:hypothetical protein